MRHTVTPDRPVSGADAPVRPLSRHTTPWSRFPPLLRSGPKCPKLGFGFVPSISPTDADHSPVSPAGSVKIGFVSSTHLRTRSPNSSQPAPHPPWPAGADRNRLRMSFDFYVETPYSRKCEIRVGRKLERDQPRSEEHTSELQSPCNLVCR